MRKNPLTQRQYDELVEKLNYLENVALPNNSNAIKDAREYGDLKENSEYHEAKDEQAKLNAELNTIKEKLNNAEIIQENENTDTVQLGHSVTIESLDTGEIKTKKILGQWDETEHTTSIYSPLGEALIDMKQDDIIYVDAPKGKLTFKILSIK